MVPPRRHHQKKNWVVRRHCYHDQRTPALREAPSHSQNDQRPQVSSTPEGATPCPPAGRAEGNGVPKKTDGEPKKAPLDEPVGIMGAAPEGIHRKSKAATPTFRRRWRKQARAQRPTTHNGVKTSKTLLGGQR